MLKTTASAFQNANKIHFRAPIRHTVGMPVELSGEDVKLFKDLDVIDLNRNGKPDLDVRESFNRLKIDMTEPVLFTSYESIERLAEQSETEIVRSEDVRAVKIGQPGYDLAKFVWSGSHKSHVRKERTLDTLVDELGAFPADAQWAIDVANDQFMVYSPTA